MPLLTARSARLSSRKVRHLIGEAMRLEGKVAIITGSSRGIGACIARRYGKEGARVAVVAHTKLDKAQAVAEEIISAGGEAKAFQADVAKVSECERLAGEVIAAF